MSRRSRGIAVYASQLGVSEAEAEQLFVERFGARMAEEAFEAQGGSAWEDDALSLRDRSLVVVAALITQGGAEERLRPHVRWALEHGATRDELEALTSLLAVYAGYPRASVGMEVIREELDRIDEEEART
ncbi:MAG TPA: carboxymuconolactone decarboxylase family protein [Gaiellaceae bacterium]|nr:carboxymuconolactone decarboxylase family protein [Gaiellaceae bacterium]